MRTKIRYGITSGPRKSMAFLILVIFTILGMSLVPAIAGEGNSNAPMQNEYQDQGPNGEQEQNGTANQTQNENGTCDQTQSQDQTQNGTCNQTQTQDQTQQQNGTCNQTQTQQQNGTCNQTQTQQQNGTCNQTQSQTQQQNGTCTCNQTQTQNQQQNGTCNQTQIKQQTQQQNGTCNQTQSQTQQQNGTCTQDQTQNRYQNCTGNCTQTQTQDRNGTCNGTCTRYESQRRSQGTDDEDQYRHRYRTEIRSGAENGTIPVETTFRYRNRNIVQENNHYQTGMEVELDDVTGNTLRVRVRAEYREGKIVVLNIEDDVVKYGRYGEPRVYFDGKQIQKCSMNEIMECKGTQAKYAGEIGEGGAQFMVYIPHFSEHVIEIESVVKEVKEEIFTPTNFMVMGIGILALIGLGGYIFKIGKERE